MNNAGLFAYMHGGEFLNSTEVIYEVGWFPDTDTAAAAGHLMFGTKPFGHYHDGDVCWFTTSQRNDIVQRHRVVLPWSSYANPKGYEAPQQAQAD